MGTPTWHDRRVWLVGAGVVALLIVAAAWLLAIHPKRSDAASLRSQAASVQSQNDVAAAHDAALARQEKHLPVYQNRLAQAMRALPATNALPQFTVEVTKLGEQTKVAVSDITIGAATPVEPTVPPAPAPTDSASSDSTSTDSTPTAATTPAATQNSIGVTVEATGTLPADRAFVYALAHASRSASVTSAQVTWKGTQAKLTVQASIFTAPIATSDLRQLRQLLAAHH